MTKEMIRRKLKASRAMLDMSQDDMATYLGLKNRETYTAKEVGTVRFSPTEMVKVTKLFGWDFPTFNDVFFDGELPDFFAHELPNGKE